MSFAPLTALERDAVATLADVLIPVSPKGLSASQADIAGSLIDALEAHAPERLVLLRRAVAFADAMTPEEALGAMRRVDPEGYDSFCETIAAIYFMSPSVREAIGFPGRLPKPARIEVTEIEDLLLPVLEAGFAPRSIPIKDG
jgi:hypothetical protein